MVYIVTETIYGEGYSGDYDSIFAVYKSESDAQKFCKDMNTKRTSVYSSSYDYEGFDVK